MKVEDDFSGEDFYPETINHEKLPNFNRADNKLIEQIKKRKSKGMLYLKLKNRNPFSNFNSIKKGVLSTNHGKNTLKSS